MAHSDGDLDETKRMQSDVREMESLEWSQPALALTAEAQEDSVEELEGQ
jgi:hypothetical protein